VLVYRPESVIVNIMTTRVPILIGRKYKAYRSAPAANTVIARQKTGGHTKCANSLGVHSVQESTCCNGRATAIEFINCKLAVKEVEAVGCLYCTEYRETNRDS